MLYLESPIGVGFSYATDTSSYGAVNDKITGMFHQFDCSILNVKLSISLLFFAFFFFLFFFLISRFSSPVFLVETCKRRKINPFTKIISLLKKKHDFLYRIFKSTSFSFSFSFFFFFPFLFFWVILQFLWNSFDFCLQKRT
jgi:hypothetical protein